MTVAVVPLDPASPLGIAMAARLTEVLGELQAAVWARRATAETQPKPQKTTPAKPPSRPVIPKTPPAGPRQPTRRAA